MVLLLRAPGTVSSASKRQTAHAGPRLGPCAPAGQARGVPSLCEVCPRAPMGRVLSSPSWMASSLAVYLSAPAVDGQVETLAWLPCRPMSVLATMVWVMEAAPGFGVGPSPSAHSPSCRAEGCWHQHPCFGLP